MPRLTITETANRLNLSPDSIRRRIRKGELQAQRDNKGQWWLELPDDAAPGVAPEEPLGSVASASIAPPNAPMQVPSDALADLRGQVADLIGRLDRAESAHKAERAELLAAAKAERNRLLALIEVLAGRSAATPAQPNAAADQVENATRRALFTWVRKATQVWKRMRAGS